MQRHVSWREKIDIRMLLCPRWTELYQSAINRRLISKKKKSSCAGTFSGKKDGSATNTRPSGPLWWNRHVEDPYISSNYPTHITFKGDRICASNCKLVTSKLLVVPRSCCSCCSKIRLHGLCTNNKLQKAHSIRQRIALI
jgi:hypothetical protein